MPLFTKNPLVGGRKSPSPSSTPPGSVQQTPPTPVRRSVSNNRPPLTSNNSYNANKTPILGGSNSFHIRRHSENALFGVPPTQPSPRVSWQQLSERSLASSWRDLQSSSRSSLANSIIYEMLESDSLNMDFKAEIQSASDSIDKLQKVYVDKVRLFVQSILNCVNNQSSSSSIGQTGRKQFEQEANSQSSSGVSCERSEVTSSRNISTLRSSPSSAEHEQHLVDCDVPLNSSNSSHFQSLFQEVWDELANQIEPHVEKQSGELMDELKGVEDTLRQLRTALEQKEKDLTKLTQSFENERKTLNDTCERLQQENRGLKEDNQRLNETVNLLHNEYMYMRTRCTCGGNGNLIPMPMSMFTEPNRTPRPNLNPRRYEIPKPNDFDSNSLPDVHEIQSPFYPNNLNDATPIQTMKRQSVSSTHSGSSGGLAETIYDKNALSAGRSKEAVASSGIGTNDTDTEDYNFISTSSPNTEVDDNSSVYKSDSLLAAFQSSQWSSDSISSSVKLPGANDSIPVPETPEYGRQKSISTGQLIPAFPTNSLNQDMFTPKSRHSSAGPQSFMNAWPKGPLLDPLMSTPQRSRGSIAVGVADGGVYNSFSQPKRRNSGSLRGSVLDMPMYDVAKETALDVVKRYKLELPIRDWPTQVCLDWLKHDLQLSEEVIQNFQLNVKDIQTLLSLKNSEMKSILGITDKFDRKRVFRAVTFLADLHSSRDSEKMEKLNLLRLDNDWMCSFFLDFVGLPEHKKEFSRCNVDGVLMSVMSLEDIESVIQNETKNAKAIKHCAVSIWHGWQLIRILKYNEKKLKQRMLACRNWDIDPIVWSSDRFYQWLKKNNFEKEAKNLNGLGVHGALLVLSKSFTIEKLFEKMKLKNSKETLRIRGNLQRKLTDLLAGPRSQALRMEENQNRDSKSRSVPLLNYAAA